MKSRWLIVMLLVGIGLLATAGAVLAQDETTPPPYAGMTNPYSWDDQTAIAAGQSLYTQKCQACHGAEGNNITPYDFSSSEFHQDLKSEPDYYFYVVSEGRMSVGMPSYKSGLSEDQRWQVITYLENLGTAATQPTATPTPTTPAGTGGTSGTPTATQPSYKVQIVLSGGLTTGSDTLLNAYVTDSNNQPVSGADVQFSLQETFQGHSGDMVIGVATTDDKGQAVLDYMPRIPGDTTLTASYSGVSAQQAITIADSGNDDFYNVDIGLHMPAGGPTVYIGSEGSKQIDANGDAPKSALRLPGGLFSWLWLYVLVVGGVWLAYFIIMWQVVGIAKEGGPGSKIVPVGALLLVVFTAVVVLLMILTGPYSQFHV
jgi:mono/diheme cytochrome c family protein